MKELSSFHPATLLYVGVLFLLILDPSINLHVDILDCSSRFISPSIGRRHVIPRDRFVRPLLKMVTSECPRCPLLVVLIAGKFTELSYSVSST